MNTNPDVPHRLPIVLASLLWACPGAGEPAPFGGTHDAGVASQVEELIIDGADWVPLAPSEVSSTPEHRRIAVYGQAVGRGSHRDADGGTSNCSGTLVQEDVYVTAAHCRENRSSGSPTLVTVTFGLFGGPDERDTGATGDFSAALRRARQRLREVGYGGRLDVISADFLRKWDCDFLRQGPGDRDIDYYHCRSKRIGWTDRRGRSRGFELTPGMVWGYAKASRDRYAGECGSEFCHRYEANVVGVNRRCDEQRGQLLFSVGDVTNDSPPNCHFTPDGWLDQYEHCLWHNADTVGGTSGGAIFNGRGRMWAVHGGWTSVEAGSGRNDPCESWDDTWSSNTGTPFSKALDEFLDEPAGGTEVRASRRASRWIGGTGGTLHRLRCPPRMVAGGVIGTTAEKGAIGSFGLVCVPNQSGSAHRIDRAVVVSGGSHDTRIGALEEDLVTVLAEHPSSSPRQQAARTGGMRSLLMCPPGEFLYGIAASTSHVLERAMQIHCVDPRTGVTQVRNSVDIGEGSGRWQASVCPPNAPEVGAEARPTVVTGLRVRSGWLTDGLRFDCGFTW